MGLDYEICYKKGKENIVADALSRVHESGDNPAALKALTAVQPNWLTRIIDSYTDDEEAQRIITGIITKEAAYANYQYSKGIIKI